jgi:hypothetical protein
MGEPVLVRAADRTEFYAEVADTGGPQTVGLDEVLSFEGVRSTVSAICGDLVGLDPARRGGSLAHRHSIESPGYDQHHQTLNCLCERASA